MRLEATGERTWLLGMFAGLTALVYGLALLGLGGRHGASGGLDHLPSPAPVAHLPEAPPERLGEVDRYAAIADRSVFSSDRSPQDFRLVSEAQPAQAVEVRLAGVLITPTIRMATLQTSSGDSLRLRQGGADVRGWRLLSVEPRSAIVDGPGGTRNLGLEASEGSPGSGMVRPGAARPSIASGSSPAASQEAAGGHGVNTAAAAPPLSSTTAPAVDGTAQERFESIRQQIEARRRQLQQGQDGASASHR